MRLSYPQGTTLHILYFTTAYESTPFLAQGRSWHLTHLPYSTLSVSYYFCLTINNILLLLKILTFLTFCWIHALFPGLPHMLMSQPHFGLTQVKTHNDYTWSLLIILSYWPIKVSPYIYPFVFMHDRTPRTLSLSLTCLNILADKIITQTIFAAQFSSGLFPHLGGTPWMPHLASPPGIHLPPAPN